MYNLVIITPDQMRRDYLGCYGHESIQTKHIDALSEQGVTLDNCYCAAPLCAPSRISFATSTYFSEHNHRNYWSSISSEVPNLVSELKDRGYRTGMYGKNHLFLYSELEKLWDGLDEICLGNYDGHEKYEHSFSSFTLEEDHPYNITGRLTDEAIGFMRENKDQPFFTWINYQDPHPAFTCPPPYDTMFDPGLVEVGKEYQDYDKDAEPVRNEVWRKHSEMDLCSPKEMRQAIAHYMGQVRYVDDSVGRVMDYLNESGLLQNTVVLFFSDHGELLGNRGMTHKIPVFYDCLTRIPAILYHPEKYHGIRFRGLVEEVDLTPTLLDLLGVDVPPTMVGKSICTALDAGIYDEFRDNVLCEAGGGAPTCKEAIPGLKLLAPHVPTSFGPGAMLREGNLKLTIYYDDQCELYDLSSDPKELNNLYGNAAYAAVQQEMTLKLLKRLLGVKVRDIKSLEWNYPKYPQDVRFEPLEMKEVIRDIRMEVQ